MRDIGKLPVWGIPSGGRKKAVLVHGVGRFESYADAARVLGVTVARITHAIRKGTRVGGYALERVCD